MKSELLEAAKMAEGVISSVVDHAHHNVRNLTPLLKHLREQIGVEEAAANISKSEPPTYQCDQCPAAWWTAGQLAEHIKKHHAD